MSIELARPMLGTVVLAVCIHLVACSQRGDQASLVRDSSGITIVESRTAQWNSSQAWTVAPQPVIDIGSDSSGPAGQLLRVRVADLPSGGLVAATRGPSEILLFDDSGGFLRKVGRSGQGPGEYRYLGNVFPCNGDTLVVQDSPHLITFSPVGQFVRTDLVRPTPEDVLLGVWHVASDCRTLLLTAGPFRIPALGEVARASVLLLWGSLDGAARDTIGTFPSWEQTTRKISGMNQSIWLAWGAGLAWAVHDNMLFIGSTDVPEVRVYEKGKGLVRIIRWSTEASPVTSDDRRLYEDRRAKVVAKYPQMVEILPLLSDYPRLPHSKPLFWSLVVGDDGYLWVRKYPRSLAGRPDQYDFGRALYETPTDSALEEWLVFDPVGRLLGTLTVPASFELKAVRARRILGVWRDELDVEHIRVHPILNRRN